MTTASSAVRLGYVAPEADEVTITVPKSPSQEQLRRDLFEELSQLGFSPEELSTLFGLFTTLGDAVEEEDVEFWFVYADGPTVYMVEMTMSAHGLLDAIMEDQQLPAPDSLHARVNAAFLPEGWTTIHDNHKYCTIDAMPVATAVQLGFTVPA